MKVFYRRKEVKRCYEKLLSSLSVGTPYYQDGCEGWSKKNTNSSKFPQKPAILTRKCQADIVRNSKNSPTTSFLIELYKYPHSSNGSLSLGHTNLLVLKLILSISKGLKHSTLKHQLQVLDLEIEWSQDPSFVCEYHLQAHLGTWIFILHAFYSWSFAHKWLEVALEL
jgi:hypothetical protein